jgi:hypothetical protein
MRELVGMLFSTILNPKETFGRAAISTVKNLKNALSKFAEEVIWHCERARTLSNKHRIGVRLAGYETRVVGFCKKCHTRVPSTLALPRIDERAILRRGAAANYNVSDHEGH